MTAFSRDVQLIRGFVKGKIIRICYDGDRYHVWTDVGSKRWFLYYRIRVINDRTELQDLIQVGCLDEELLVEPPEYPYLSQDFINDAQLIKKAIGEKIKDMHQWFQIFGVDGCGFKEIFHVLPC